MASSTKPPEQAGLFDEADEGGNEPKVRGFRCSASSTRKEDDDTAGLGLQKAESAHPKMGGTFSKPPSPSKVKKRKAEQQKRRSTSRGVDGDDPGLPPLKPRTRLFAATTSPSSSRIKKKLPSPSRSNDEEERIGMPITNNNLEEETDTRTAENLAVSSQEAILPHATPVTAQNGSNHRGRRGSSGPIAIATKFTWCDMSNRRVRVFALLGLIAVLGTVAGVVYAIVSSQNNGPKKGEDHSSGVSPSPTWSTVPPSSAPSTNAPMSIVLEQIGETLYGATSNSHWLSENRGELFFGWSVKLSANGERLIASAPSCPCVHIFEFTNKSWVKSAELTGFSGTVDHTSLSGDGNVLVVGFPGAEDSLPVQGHVRGKVQVFEHKEGKWQKLGGPLFGVSPTDHIGGFIDDDFFHYDYIEDDEILSTDTFDSGSISLSYNGSVLAVGSYRGNYVRVLRYDNVAGQWSRLGNSDFIMGEEGGDAFGSSVDLSGDGMRLIVGAPQNIGKAIPSNYIYNGHVRVFQYDENANTWVKLGQDIDGSIEGGGDGTSSALQLGASVSISNDGSTILVGAVSKATSEDPIGFGMSRGYVKVFKYSEGRDEWIQKGNTINAFQAGLDEPGEADLVEYLGKYPIASKLSGDASRLAVSVPFESLNEAVTGVVRLFELRGDVWTVIGDPVEGSQRFSFSGRSIDLSYDGSRLAIGAPQYDKNRVDDGEVRVFEVQEHSRGTSTPTILPTVSPAPSPQGVPITVFIVLFDWEQDRYGWNLRCDGNLLASFPVGTYVISDVPTNISETITVQDDVVCQLKLYKNDFHTSYYPSYQVFYGVDVTNKELAILESDMFELQFDFQSEVTFVASNNTVSVTLLLQLDAFPEETSWDLQCNNASYASAPLGTYQDPVGNYVYDYRNQLINATFMGIEEKASCKFAIGDSYGDGLCCDQGLGFYKIYYGVPKTQEEGTLLVAGGEFVFEETVSFTVSPSEDPIIASPGTSFPTSSPGPTQVPIITGVPTSSPAPSHSIVPITVVIMLGDSTWSTGWNITCENSLIADVPPGTYEFSSGLVVETLFVEDGTLCEFTVVGLSGTPPGYFEIHYGEGITEGTPLVAGSQYDDSIGVNFTVSPAPTVAPSISPFPTTSKTVAISFVLQLDAFAMEIGWSLQCDGVMVANFPIGTYRFASNKLVTEIVLVEDGAECQFIMSDTRGDGFCCHSVNEYYGDVLGYYKIYYGKDTTDKGILLAAGQRFDYIEIVTFTVSPFEDPQTPSPSVPPPTWMPSTTLTPTIAY